MVRQRDEGQAGIDACQETRRRIYPLLLRTLSERERSEVLAHTSACEACSVALHAVRGRIERIEGVPSVELHDRKRERGRRRLRFVLLLLPLVPAALAYVLLIRQGLEVARYRTERRFMNRLDIALEAYQRDHGRLPPSDGAPLAVHLLGSDPHGRPYLDPSRERLDAAGRFVDSWGRPYRYRRPGVHRPGSYDLQSLGANGRDDGGRRDDCSNWD